MVYKYSDNYDEIIDLDADIEFIKNLYSLEQKVGYNKLKKQLRKIYELERIAHRQSIMDDIGKVWYEEGINLSWLLQSRAYKLIEKVGMEYLKETRMELETQIGKEEIMHFIESYNSTVIELTISILKICLFIADNRGTNIILSKERDIERYRKIYSALTSSNPEIKEQAKQKILSNNNCKR